MKPSHPASHIKRQWLTGGLASVFAAGVGLVLLLFPIGGGVTLLSYDLPFAFKSGHYFEDVVLVYLDEASHSALKQPTTLPWDRSLHAQLVDRLTAEGARAIVFDILFTDPSSNPASDERLAQAIRRSKRVVLAGLYDSRELLPLAKVKWEELPYEKFRAPAADWGNANLLIDPDDGVRHYFPFIHNISGQTNVPWLPWAVARFAGADNLPAPTVTSPPLWLNYYGPPNTLPNVSYFQALLPQGTKPGFFKNKIVFVGAQMSAGFSGQSKDAFRTPYSFWGKDLASGVEIHATAALNLLHRDWLTRLPLPVELMGILTTALLAGFLLMRCRPLSATLWAAVAMVVIVLTAHLLALLQAVWFAWAIQILEVGTTLFCSVVANSLSLFVEKQLLEQSLAAHLSPTLVKRLSKDPALRRPGGLQQEVSILFSDIANFSAVCGTMSSDDLVRLINRYYEAALGCIHETDGTVVSLIGDAIFAIWNAPVEQRDHRERACRAALSLRACLAKFGDSTHNLPLRTRFALHAGVTCIGNIGSASHFEYTAMGENTNLTSRLEGLNKYLGTEVLVTREIQRAVETTLVSRPVGHFRLKGTTRVLEVYELIGYPGSEANSSPWRNEFADALQDFRRRKFDNAAERFRKVIELRRKLEPDFIPINSSGPGDGPSQFYLDKINELRAYPPAGEWLGEIDLLEK